MHDSDEAKEDSNNDSDVDDVNDTDNDLADNNSDYSIPEEDQNPTFRANQAVQREK